MLKSKKFKALCLAVAIVLAVPVFAFADSYSNYAISNDSPTGKDVDLGTSEKEYSFKMTGPNSAAVTLQLWQTRYFGDYCWPKDQTFSPKSKNQTAWWYGYQSEVATYHIYGDFIGDNGESIVLNGTLRNR